MAEEEDYMILLENEEDDLKEEMRLVKHKNKGYHLPLFYKEEFFETKQVVYVKLVK